MQEQQLAMQEQSLKRQEQDRFFEVVTSLDLDWYLHNA